MTTERLHFETLVKHYMMEKKLYNEHHYDSCWTKMECIKELMQDMYHLIDGDFEILDRLEKKDIEAFIDYEIEEDGVDGWYKTFEEWLDL